MNIEKTLIGLKKYVKEQYPFISIKGCSLQEIMRFEESINANLPHIFNKFLQVFGLSDDFLSDIGCLGKDTIYSILLSLKSRFLQACADAMISERLNDMDFIFISRENTYFYFFRLNEGDDPPVFVFNIENAISNKMGAESQPREIITQVSLSISDFFQKFAKIFEYW